MLRRLLVVVCWAEGLWWSLRTFNPFTPLGAVPISGHDYAERPSRIEGDRLIEPLECDRCGYVTFSWREVF